jgi:hypothetical protein
MYSYTVHIPSSASISPKTILANKPHQAAKIFSDFLESSGHQNIQNIQNIQKIHVTNVKGKTLLYSLHQLDKKIVKVPLDKEDNKDDNKDKDNKSVNSTNNQVAKRMLKFAMNSAMVHNKNLEKKKVKK